jgi:hypothetical protein
MEPTAVTQTISTVEVTFVDDEVVAAVASFPNALDIAICEFNMYS